MHTKTPMMRQSLPLRGAGKLPNRGWVARDARGDGSNSRAVSKAIPRHHDEKSGQEPKPQRGTENGYQGSALEPTPNPIVSNWKKRKSQVLSWQFDKSLKFLL